MAPRGRMSSDVDADIDRLKQQLEQRKEARRQEIWELITGHGIDRLKVSEIDVALWKLSRLLEDEKALASWQQERYVADSGEEERPVVRRGRKPKEDATATEGGSEGGDEVRAATFYPNAA